MLELLLLSDPFSMRTLAVALGSKPAVAGPLIVTLQVMRLSRHEALLLLQPMGARWHDSDTSSYRGKGDPAEWVAVIKPGRILYEIEGIPEDVAHEACRLASHKIPLATKFLSRSHAYEG